MYLRRARPWLVPSTMPSSRVRCTKPAIALFGSVTNKTTDEVERRFYYTADDTGRSDDAHFRTNTIAFAFVQNHASIPVSRVPPDHLGRDSGGRRLLFEVQQSRISLRGRHGVTQLIIYSFERFDISTKLAVLFTNALQGEVANPMFQKYRDQEMKMRRAED